MVLAERTATHGPRDLTDGAGLDQLARPRHLREENLARRRDDSQIALLCEGDQLVGFADRRGHGLVRVDVHPRLQRGTTVLVVQPVGGSDADGVDLPVREHLVDARERVRDPVALGCCFGSFEDGVAESPDGDAIAHVVLGEVGQDAAQGQRTHADNADPERTRLGHAASTLTDPSAVRRDCR